MLVSTTRCRAHHGKAEAPTRRSSWSTASPALRQDKEKGLRLVPVSSNWSGALSDKGLTAATSWSTRIRTSLAQHLAALERLPTAMAAVLQPGFRTSEVYARPAAEGPGPRVLLRKERTWVVEVSDAPDRAPRHDRRAVRTARRAVRSPSIAAEDDRRRIERRARAPIAAVNLQTRGPLQVARLAT